MGGVGVRGANSQNGVGVKGVSNTGSTTADGNGSGIGVHGKSNTGVGVQGAAPNGYGIYGFGGIIGLTGISVNATGLWGQSTSNIGVVGYSVSNATGVFGTSQGPGTGVRGESAQGYGVEAVANAANVPALNVRSTVIGPGKLAAAFYGDILISGSYAATGTKSAIVPHPDGALRTLYCLESAEAYFDDYGRAQLVGGGVARVQLDPDFAPLVQRNGYHVFLTAEGPANNLYLSQQDASGFEVREMGGTSTVPFSYRIVGKRVDVAGERVKKVTPDAKKALLGPAANGPRPAGPLNPNNLAGGFGPGGPSQPGGPISPGPVPNAGGLPTPSGQTLPASPQGGGGAPGPSGPIVPSGGPGSR